jgi:hypothetical protein
VAGFFAPRCLTQISAHAGVEASVNIGNFASNAACQIGQQESSGIADFFDGDIAA